MPSDNKVKNITKNAFISTCRKHNVHVHTCKKCLAVFIVVLRSVNGFVGMFYTIKKRFMNYCVLTLYESILISTKIENYVVQYIVINICNSIV